MKQTFLNSSKVLLIVAANIIPHAIIAAEPAPDAVEVIKVAIPAEDFEQGDAITRKKSLSVNFIESSGDDLKGKERTWLGVGLAEPEETLVAQLGLKDGVGLVVTHVAKDSPAEKAGLQKNDVLLEMNGHNLVVPQQLQKLVQARKDGDKVTLKLLRGGKRDSISVTLGKTTVAALTTDGADSFFWRSGDLAGLARAGKNQAVMGETLRKALDDAKLDQELIQVEVRKSVDVARKAVEEALRTARVSSADAISQAQKRELEALARTGVFVPSSANVTIRTTEKSSKSLVRTDDSGTIVLVKNPKLRLTVHDGDGKLVFDGEVETSQQRAGIPADLRSKVEPLIEQFVPDGDE